MTTVTPSADTVETAPSCPAEPGCITCGDVAVALIVVSETGGDARCRDGTGREELVATELVGPVAPGDRLLVHAGVAIQRLGPEAPENAPTAAKGG